LSQRFPEITFIDQVQEAMSLLESKFNEYFKGEPGAENSVKVQFITADARVVNTPMSGNVVIAGVGGKNMMEMLEGLHQSPEFKPTRLILSPHRNPEIFEKPEMLGLKHSHTKTVIESGRTISIFVFSA